MMTFTGVKHSANRNMHWKQRSNKGKKHNNTKTKWETELQRRQTSEDHQTDKMKQTTWCNSQRMMVIMTTGDRKCIWRNVTHRQNGVQIKLRNECASGSRKSALYYIILYYITSTEYRDILYQCNCLNNCHFVCCTITDSVKRNRKRKYRENTSK
jgi:hypothetical protein